ncbi:glycerol-3-phosphate 1-O-acyltransferase PlsY [Photobacterium sp.]|uniref:glycerol-3-phosphate 1-O-acyltransferase PlsY n=1 Tax=Photobacterium sp. TaxID=660 RepID=UPI00299D4663|nr:glycerol-3-phosphate 1-O-acyltransferase PlsY [Photobacterium sp.]MDX1303423.1 glycerol-3-phosphate 1-O-acyltransferase PlsY [Photobacterium sp.]
MTPLVLLIIIGAYLLGSISSAVLITRFYGLPDPRDSGSGNPGATNVLRLGGKKVATMVLICDILKGMLPVWLSYYLNINPFLLGIIGIAACLGHIYPIFFHFRGGKGVATALGALAPIGWDLSGMLIGTWLLAVFITGYSSLASLITALAAPMLTWMVKPEYTMPVSMLSCLIVLRHHDNVRRLLEGKETKIWQKISRKTKSGSN